MTSEEVSRIIAKDLAASSTSMEWFGRPIEECLTQPTLKVFADSFNDNQPINLWLVFEENPENNSGYKIVYSQDDRIFGLAVSGNELDVLIGFYGSFVETINSM